MISQFANFLRKKIKIIDFDGELNIQRDYKKTSLISLIMMMKSHKKSSFDYT